MDVILQSNHDPIFKLKLVAAWKTSMAEIMSDVYRMEDIAEIEASVAAAILQFAAEGQTSPGQLQRFAVSQAKSLALHKFADHLHIHAGKKRA